MEEPESDAADPVQDEALFLRCLARERRRLHHFIYSLVPNSADAEDVFQQASVTMWRRFSEYDRDRDFYAWACGVAFYTVQNFRRATQRRRMLFSDELVRQEDIDGGIEGWFAALAGSLLEDRPDAQTP